MQETLRNKTVTSLASSYFIMFATRSINIIAHIILVRIIAPEHFGLFALAFLVLNIAKIFSQLGLGQYIIREEKVHYGVLFTLYATAGLLVFIVLQAISPFLYKYNPSLPPINRILAIALIPHCLTGALQGYAYKELKFKKLIVPNILNTLTFGLAAILFSLRNYGVWALVYGQIVSDVVFLIAIWAIFSGSVKITFDFKIRDLLKPARGAKYFYMLSIFAIFSSGIDKIILGKLVQLKEIGYYTVAMTLAAYPMNIIEPALNNVFYPLFSKIKSDISKTKEFYSHATVILYWLEIPLYLFLAFNADIAVRIILGPKWLPSVNLFRLLAIWCIANPCATFGIHIIQAHSKENIQLYLRIIYFVLFMFVGWYCVKQFGVIGIIYAQLLLYSVQYVLLYFVNKITGNVLQLLRRLLPIYLVTVSGFGIIYFLFQRRIAAFFVSLVYLVLVYLFFYVINIRAVMREKFGDVEIFRKLKIV